MYCAGWNGRRVWWRARGCWSPSRRRDLNSWRAPPTVTSGWRQQSRRSWRRWVDVIVILWLLVEFKKRFLKPIGLSQATNALVAPIKKANSNVDMRVVRGVRGAPAGASDQLLPDFYCEHTTLAMNKERRKQVRTCHIHKTHPRANIKWSRENNTIIK